MQQNNNLSVRDLNHMHMHLLNVSVNDFPKSIKRFIDIKKTRIAPLLFFKQGPMGIGQHYANLLTITNYLSKIIKDIQ